MGETPSEGLYIKFGCYIFKKWLWSGCYCPSEQSWLGSCKSILALNNLLDATTTEVTTIQKGLDLVESLGSSQIIIGSGSLEVIQACNGVIETWSPYTAILAHYFQKDSGIGAITFAHYPREVPSSPCGAVDRAVYIPTQLLLDMDMNWTKPWYKPGALDSSKGSELMAQPWASLSS